MLYVQDVQDAQEKSVMEIQFDGNLVVIQIPKAVLALTREQFIAALKKGKTYRRREALKARIPQPAETSARSPA
jgi:hypothetical protein